MALSIRSTAFENGAGIPVEHTCDGDNTSPPLNWEGEPGGTVTFALIMEDPDSAGGTFAHWIVYNLPADCHGLEKTIPIEKNLENKTESFYESLNGLILERAEYTGTYKRK